MRYPLQLPQPHQQYSTSVAENRKNITNHLVVVVVVVAIRKFRGRILVLIHARTYSHASLILVKKNVYTQFNYYKPNIFVYAPQRRT